MYQVPQHIPQTIFRAYDIRGIVDESLTPDVVYAVGRAFASEARDHEQIHVVAGRDGRLSATDLFPALCEGLRDSGCEVIDVGPLPTPVLYYATHKLETQTGIMLTGSHNPANYNGLKMVIKGQTLTTHRVLSLRERIEQGAFHSDGGRISEYSTIIDDYIGEIASSVKLQKTFKVVVDCGNGIGGAVFPKLLEALGCEVIPLYCEVDGRFPNHHPDPAVTKNMEDLQSKVRSEKAEVGFALDGDGDRLGMVTDQGDIIWPDRYLMLLARQVLQANRGGQVIFDVKCTRHLPEVIKAYGGEPVMWKTGHSLLKMKLQETNAPLAGELSGHVFFNDRWYGFDDGLYTATRILEALSEESSKSVSQILSSFPDDLNTPELKLYVPEEQKFQLMETIQSKVVFEGAEINTIDGLRVDYSDGWGLIRPSNTTPCLILRFEAANQTALQRIQQQFRDQLLGVDPHLKLPF